MLMMSWLGGLCGERSIDAVWNNILIVGFISRAHPINEIILIFSRSDTAQTVVYLSLLQFTQRMTRQFDGRF